MKAQYFGDVNDYRKFALLRLLAGVGDFKIGVCWMLTEDDKSGQGGNRNFVKMRGEWRRYDPEVFDALEPVPEKPRLQDLQRVEAEGLIRGATYFDEHLSDNRDARVEWHARCLAALTGVELAFFDPDNGLEIAAKPRGRKHSNKFAFLDELSAHFDAGRSVLVYQHFPKLLPRAGVIDSALGRLRGAMPSAATWAFRTPFVVFLLASRPEHAARVAACLTELKRLDWPPRFFDPEIISR